MPDSLWNEAIDVRGEIYPCTTINVRKKLKLMKMGRALVDHLSSVDLVQVSAEKEGCKVMMIGRIGGSTSARPTNENADMRGPPP